MAGSTTRAIGSTFVSSASQNADHRDRNFASQGKLSVQAGDGPVVAASGGIRQAFLQFGLLAPVGSRVTSSRLELRLHSPVTANTTVIAERITQSWKTRTTTWNRRPDVSTENSASVVVPAGSPTGSVVTLDLTDMIAAAAASGTPWYGVRLRSTSLIQFTDNSRPVIEDRPRFFAYWSDYPEVPTGLIPSGGAHVGVPTPVLSWDFVDYGGDKTIGQLQVQIGTSQAMTSILYDSGEQDSTNRGSAWDPVGFTASEGTNYWWHVRHADGRGLWSDWSDPRRFRYAPRPAINVVSPLDNRFTDATPLLIANATGSTRWQLHVDYGIVGYGGGTDTRLWSSDIFEGDEVSFEVPAKVIKRETWHTFVFVAWDDVDRVATAGRPVYMSMRVHARFEGTDGITPVDDLTVTPWSPMPRVDLTWKRLAPCDGFLIQRGQVGSGNAVIVDRVDYEDVLTDTPGEFAYTDITAGSGRWLYSVRPVEDRVTAGRTVADSVFAHVETGARWLIVDKDRMVPILTRDGPGDHGLELREHSEEIELANGRIAIQTMGLYGYAGEVEGQIMDAPQGFGLLSLEEAEELVREIRRSGQARFAIADLNFPARIAQVNLQRAHPAHLRSTDVQFRVIQDGEEDITGLLGDGQ